MKKSGVNWNFIAAVALCVILLLVILLAAAWYLTPGYEKPEMNTGEITITVQEDGGLLLEWPEQSGKVFYLVSLETQDEKRQIETSLPSTVFSDISLEEPLQIRIQTAIHGKNLLGAGRQLVSDTGLEAAVGPQMLTRPVLESTAGQNGHLALTWDVSGRGRYEVCTVEDGVCTPFTTVQGGSADIRFTAGGDLEPPSDSISLVVRAVFSGNNYVLYGPLSEPVTVRRDDLLGSSLVLEYAENKDGSYTLNWNESIGDYYLVQEWDPDGQNWVSLQHVNPDGPLSYDLGFLPSGSSHRYRVSAQLQGMECAAGELSLRAGFSPLYATVWPIQDLPLYSTSGKDSRLATVPGGTALCVLEETDGFFFVRCQNLYGYLDSHFCMINLPDYLGTLCDYDIPNSYRSDFTIHGYKIPGLTEETVKGFENVQTAEGDFLVPLLYPTAQKLAKAAEAAGEDGFRLKIYEAYRPNEATRFLYSTTLAVLNITLPNSPDNFPVIPESEPEEGEPALPPDDELSEETAAPDEEESAGPKTDTYGWLMSNGKYRLSVFLEASVSHYNRGIALDVTLESLEDGEELEMPSAVHDLSWYAFPDDSSDNAQLLAYYMKDIGGLNSNSSAWWRFQDDETRSELKLSGFLSKGISSEGWVKDDAGWRYRNADGSIQYGGSVIVDGMRYELGADGYVKEPL